MLMNYDTWLRKQQNKCNYKDKEARYLAAGLTKSQANKEIWNKHPGKKVSDILKNNTNFPIK